MPTLPEQGLHLLSRDVVASVDAVDPSQSGAEPLAWRFALLRVVVAQAGVPLLGAVMHRDLPRQVRVTVPGGQLVQAHHAVSRRARDTRCSEHGRRISVSARGVWQTEEGGRK